MKKILKLVGAVVTMTALTSCNGAVVSPEVAQERAQDIVAHSATEMGNVKRVGVEYNTSIKEKSSTSKYNFKGAYAAEEMFFYSSLTVEDSEKAVSEFWLYKDGEDIIYASNVDSNKTYFKTSSILFNSTLVTINQTYLGIVGTLKNIILSQIQAVAASADAVIETENVSITLRSSGEGSLSITSKSTSNEEGKKFVSATAFVVENYKPVSYTSSFASDNYKEITSGTFKYDNQVSLKKPNLSSFSAL